jgi:hypothetical protein
MSTTAMSYPADIPHFSQKRAETYAWTREWLLSCVRMIRVGPMFFGEREEGTGVSTTADLWPIGK